MENKLYEDIAQRTQGDIYIGVVGPVRTGKSTFIKRFMETLVLPKIENSYIRDRARDELPQSGSGRVVMTAEPKFVPEDAVEMAMEDGSVFSVRLIDCVGYMVPSALGQMDGEQPRMVMTPWFNHEIPMTQAAEFGTQKVITDHSTIGIVVTTDGTVADIPREDYLEAEERVISELKGLGKPFMVLLNSAQPYSERAQTLQADIAERYDVTCLAANCLTLDEGAVSEIIRAVLHEFPMKQMDLFLPPWVDVLPFEHPIKSGLYAMIREETEGLTRLRDAEGAVLSMGDREEVSSAVLNRMDMGSGVVTVTLDLPRSLFYSTVSERCGLEIQDDGDLIDQLTQMAAMKRKYEKVEGALAQVEATGYGIVMPNPEEMTLEEPEIVKQGGRYGVRLKASAPSIHIIWSKKKFRTARSAEHKDVSDGMCGIGINTEGDGSIWRTVPLFIMHIHRAGQAYEWIGSDAMTYGIQSELKSEIMLQVNERLYLRGLISRELYEQAKFKIVKMNGSHPLSREFIGAAKG